MQIFLAGTARPLTVHCPESITFAELAETVAVKLDKRHELWFQHCGRRCKDSSSLARAGLKDGSTVHMHLRLRGGGGDGGATGAESRSSYLEMYMEKKPDKVNPAEEKLARWTTCKLSGEPLQPPCVVDQLGSLYNKEALVSALVSKSMPKALGHISSLKHVRDVKLSHNTSAAKNTAAAREAHPGHDVSFQCPISGQPLNGQYRFCVVLPTGHVISEKAVKQVPSAVRELIGSSWEEARPLNGTQAEVEALWDKLIASRASTKKSKKARLQAGSISTAPADSVPANEVKLEARSSSEGSPTNSTERKLQSEGLIREAGVKRGVQDFSAGDRAQAKKIKAKDLAPANADKKLWASLFTSSHGKNAVETYSCRSTSGRGWM